MRGQTNPLHSWLRENFGIRTTMGLEENLVAYQLPQDRYLIPLLRALKPGDSPNEECYPLAAVKFGLGYLIPIRITPLTTNWFNILLTDYLQLISCNNTTFYNIII